LHWVPQSIFLVVLGVVIHFAGWKMNKQLWSPSYLFMMAGACGKTPTHTHRHTHTHTDTHTEKEWESGVVVGVVTHFAGWKNKQLWSPSYLFMSETHRHR
jgi:hypothetical protein